MQDTIKPVFEDVQSAHKIIRRRQTPSNISIGVTFG